MLETHLMIERPERHVGEFVKAGAHSVTFHVEATPHVAYTADLIRGDGAGVGWRSTRPHPPRRSRR